MSFFWSGDVLDDFLFKGLNTKSWGGLFGVCFGLLSIAVLYEGLHVLKGFFLNRFLHTRKKIKAEFGTISGGNNRAPYSENSSSRTRCLHNGGGDAPRSLLEETSSADVIRLQNRTSLSNQSGFLDLIASAILHSIYISIGFTLMNAVMTFNVYVMSAICFGIGLGYFFFGNYRRLDDLIYPIETETTSLNDSDSTAPVQSGSSREGVKTFPNAGQGGGPGPYVWLPDKDNNSTSPESSESTKLIVGAQVHTPRILSSSSTSP